MTAAAVSLAAFLVIESRSKHAMLTLGLFSNRSFLGTIVAALLINFAAFAALTYSSIWLQTVIGLSPIEAGLTGLPLAATAFLTSAGVGRFVHGQPGRVIGGGMLLVGIGSVLVSVFVQHGSSWPALVPGFVTIGIGVGLAMPVLTSSAMSAVTPQRFGMAAGAVNTARQLGYAIGIAVLGSVFSHQAASSLHRPGSTALARSLAGGQSRRLLASAGGHRSSLDSALHLAAISGIDGAFVVAGIGGVIAGLLALALIRPASRHPDSLAS
jgi:predicted MFS family arabinose efflux permease